MILRNDDTTKWMVWIFNKIKYFTHSLVFFKFNTTTVFTSLFGMMCKFTGKEKTEPVLRWGLKRKPIVGFSERGKTAQRKLRWSSGLENGLGEGVVVKTSSKSEKLKVIFWLHLSNYVLKHKLKISTQHNLLGMCHSTDLCDCNRGPWHEAVRPQASSVKLPRALKYSGSAHDCDLKEYIVFFKKTWG